MIKEYTIKFECKYEAKGKDKQKLINEIEGYFQTMNGLSLIYERKILPILEEHPFDGSTVSYHSNKEGISFFFFTDILSGEIKINLSPRND